MAIVAVILVIAGVVLMFSVSAILGSILYVAAFLYSLYVLRPKILVDGQLSVEGFTNALKSKDFLNETLYAFVIASAIIVIPIALYCWIWLDSKREVEAISEMYQYILLMK